LSFCKPIDYIRLTVLQFRHIISRWPTVRISYSIVIIESSIMNDDQCQHYDSKVHRRMHHNNNPFVLRRYDGRIKKCWGCKVAFKGATARPKFVISHLELYFYGRIKGSKRLLTTQRDIFYHCDPDCIQPRHPYFHMCDIVTNPAVARHLNQDDIEHLHSLGVFL